MNQWRPHVHKWGDGSGDLALPIPLSIQRAHKFNAQSVVQAKMVRGKLLISLVKSAKAPRVALRAGASIKRSLKAKFSCG